MIPEQTQGIQAWDRYAYINNNPIRYDDPTGHCLGCLWAAIDAVSYYVAQTYFPADAKGSQVAFTVTLTPFVVGQIGEANIVTTAKGTLQFYTTNDLQSMSPLGDNAHRGTIPPEARNPAIGTPQIGVSVTSGPIYGNFNSTTQFGGDGAQAWLGIAPLTEGPSIALDGWASNDGSIYGGDSGLGLGISYPPVISLGVAKITAVPRSEEIVLSGTQLLLCRIALQCGRTGTE